MSFSCTLIGSDTLLQECGELLLAKGHSIGTVITDTGRIASWARSKGLEVAHPKDEDLVARVKAQSPDYLFAITYLAIVKDDLLATASKGAINFHDGPLPTYAGLNTPAWALIKQEPSYGISWHEMTSGIDEGVLLKQVTFDVAERETSLSINTRNFAAALESFEALIGELDQGTVTRTPQDGERGYFGRHDRPTKDIALDLSRPAAELDALIRALDFGAYPNPVGAASLVVNDKAVIVKAAEVTTEVDGSIEPHLVVGADDSAIVVGTHEHALTITAVTTLTGGELSLADAAEHLGIAAGSKLPELDGGLKDALGARSESVSKAERFWMKRLAALEPIELPWTTGARESTAATKTLDIAVPEGFASHAADLDHGLATAAAIYLGRIGAKSAFHLATNTDGLTAHPGVAPLLSTQVPLLVELDWSAPFAQAQQALKAERDKLGNKDTFLVDALARDPSTAGHLKAGGALVPVGLEVDVAANAPLLPGAQLVARVNGGKLALAYDSNVVDQATAEKMADQVASLLDAIVANADTPVGQLSLLSEAQRRQMLTEWNATTADVESLGIHELFHRQADATPEAVAVRCEGQSLTYKELDERANALAEQLIASGAGADSLVGVHVDRSVELMVAVIGVLKAGAAYVPLDPSYPADRIAYMVEHAKLTATVSRGPLKRLLPSAAPHVIDVDTVTAPSTVRPSAIATDPDSLAYVIYTSGSTGRPKGVMVEHRNAVNFFVGMDEVIPHAGDKRWLAVTSLSFDISVLELLWTLTRGFEVVIHKDTNKASDEPPRSTRTIDFGLFYWGNDDGPGRQKYRMLLEGAKFADAHGFNSVWTPERHFHAFGGPYPNPAVTGAAVAAVTRNLSVRSGSCVVPLHHPARIAEEWAVIDNLSEGRAALSIAAGWQPDDFLLQPQNYPGNKQAMFDNVEIVRKLWRGEAVTFPGPMGDVDVVTQPRPVQKDLPIWVTTAGNPATYKQAAEVGGNVLTHLLGQSVEEVGEKIKIYRDTLKELGKDPASGTVTLMLHCYVGDDIAAVKEIVREPMKDYLRSSIGLVKQYAWTFPAFKRPEGAKSALDVDLTTLSEDETEAILEFAFERYFEDSGLFGDLDTCMAQLERIKAIEVDEIACLIDFGVDSNMVLGMLPKLAELHAATNDVPDAADAGDVDETDYSIAALIERHHISHMQCTPSMARMLCTDADTEKALAKVAHLFIGGEAFPLDLAQRLTAATEGTVRNMYGPTETTIWSSTEPVEKGLTSLTIGRPIANTRLYILNDQLEPQPVGVPGHLWIGGQGVVRGYLHQPELTEERFVNDPFVEGERIYHTGDVARFTDDGKIDFIGRADHQVKIRGYRVELGEIEARLLEHESVRVAATIVREDQPGDQRLVAYVVGESGPCDEATLRDHCRGRLPEYMVPQHVVSLAEMPQTPNKKIDRKALPAPTDVSSVSEAEMVAPTSEVESKLAQIWCDLLGREQVGIDSNFFDLGGHSLLVVRLNREIKEQLEKQVSLTDLYRFPTIRTFVASLESGGVSEQVKESADRGARRREAMAARRRRRGRA
jgi:natural product biosynthesis luciferase-like monooxygenase protein